MKLHLEGKTEQARADLARLAIIKKQREDAAKKRDDIKKGEKTQQGTLTHSVNYKWEVLMLHILIFFNSIY